MFGKWVRKPINKSGAEQSASDGRNRARQKLVLHLYRIVARIPETRNEPQVVCHAKHMLPDAPEQRSSQISCADPNLASSPVSHIGTSARSFALQDPIDLVAAPGQLDAEQHGDVHASRRKSIRRNNQ